MQPLSGKPLPVLVTLKLAESVEKVRFAFSMRLHHL